MVKIKCLANKWVLVQRGAYSGYLSRTSSTNFKYTTRVMGDPAPVNITDGGNAIALFSTDRREYIEKTDPYDWYVISDSDDFINVLFSLNPIMRPAGNAKIGDITGGNYFEVEPDGTDVRHGKGTLYNDMRFPFFGRRLDRASGHLDYDIVDLGVTYDDTSRYNDLDMIAIIAQLGHDHKTGTALPPHVHWIQNQNEIPNALLKYRVYDNGEVPGSWTLAKPKKLVFPYLKDSLQILEFPDIDTTSLTGVSAFVDIKLFRDTANASGLFAGADPYTGNVLMKEFDFHYQVDMLGSRTEYTK